MSQAHRKELDALRRRIQELHPKMSNSIGTSVVYDHEIEAKGFILKVPFKVEKMNSSTARRQAVNIILEEARKALEEFLDVQFEVEPGKVGDANQQNSGDG